MDTRTSDPQQSVVAAGEALKDALEAAGFGVVHDTTVNDTLYNGSYSRSWEVLQKNLEEYPTIQVTIDVHRDSMTTDSGVKYKPTVTINGRKAAQVMLLAGCDADGSWGDFPRWEENLRLDLRVQEKLQELFPGLARPMSCLLYTSWPIWITCANACPRRNLRKRPWEKRPNLPGKRWTWFTWGP